MWVVLAWVIYGLINITADTKVSYPSRLMPKDLIVVIEGGLRVLVKEGSLLVHWVEMGWQVPE
jgi:hypothetical protein